MEHVKSKMLKLNRLAFKHTYTHFTLSAVILCYFMLHAEWTNSQLSKTVVRDNLSTSLKVLHFMGYSMSFC